MLFASWLGLGPDGLKLSSFISPVPLALTIGTGKACDLNKIEAQKSGLLTRKIEALSGRNSVQK